MFVSVGMQLKHRLLSHHNDVACGRINCRTLVRLTITSWKVRMVYVASSTISTNVTCTNPYDSLPRVGQYWSHFTCTRDKLMYSSTSEQQIATSLGNMTPEPSLRRWHYCIVPWATRWQNVETKFNCEKLWTEKWRTKRSEEEIN